MIILISLPKGYYYPGPSEVINSKFGELIVYRTNINTLKDIFHLVKNVFYKAGLSCFLYAEAGVVLNNRECRDFPMLYGYKE